MRFSSELVRALVAVLLLTACTGAASSTGEPQAPCTLDSECADAVPCTRDRCLGGACRHEPEPLACDDANACTRDACHPENGCLNLADREGQACDDANGCTTGDVCALGVCAGSAVSCDDGDPCTADACDPQAAACAHPAAADGLACDDGDACTDGDACSAGLCVGGADSCECRADADCAAAEDGDLCNGVLVCAWNACAVDPASVVACDTTGDSECRKTVCEVATGQCLALPLHEGLPCAPDEACATAGLCAGGVCQATAWRACDDGNACTRDACDPVTGECASAAEDAGSPCDDGDLCTSTDTCDGGGACVGGLGTPCDDGNPCTVDLCKPSTGQCVFAAAVDGQGCDDGDPCTEGDACQNATCAPATTTPGCCHADSECDPPGPCRGVRCGPAHTCDVTVQPDCCGNDVVEAGEDCEPGSDLAPGACDDTCDFAVFDLAADLAGSVLTASAAISSAPGTIRVAATVEAAADPDADGLYLVDFAGGGQRVGVPLKLADAPALAAGIAVHPAAPDNPNWIMSEELSEVAWLVPPAGIFAQGVVGTTPVLQPEKLTVTTAWDFLARPLDAEEPAPARGPSVRFVMAEDQAPTLAVAVPAVLDPEASSVDDYPLRTEPLLVTLLRTDGWLLFKDPPYLMTQIYDDSGTEPVGLWTWTAHSSLTVTAPAFVRVGPYSDLVSVRVIDAATAAPRVDLVRRFFWDAHADLGISQVLWSVEGTGFYPFSPAVVEGADVTYGLVVFPMQTVPAVEAPPLGLVRMTYDGQVTEPVLVLPEKQATSVRHELVRLGPDRLALVYDELQAPDGFENPATIRLGLSYAVLTDEGQTVVPPTSLLASAPRRLPTFTVLALPTGGLVVVFVERVDGVGRLRARFVAPLAP